MGPTGVAIDVEPLADGEIRQVVIADHPVAYARIDDRYFAIDDTCTHAKVSLSEGIIDEDDCTIECPKHGSLFSLATGEAITLPATRPVRVHRVDVGETRVTITLSEEAQ